MGKMVANHALEFAEAFAAGISEHSTKPLDVGFSHQSLTPSRAFQSSGSVFSLSPKTVVSNNQVSWVDDAEAVLLKDSFGAFQHRRVTGHEKRNFCGNGVCNLPHVRFIAVNNGVVEQGI